MAGTFWCFVAVSCTLRSAHTGLSGNVRPETLAQNLWVCRLFCVRVVPLGFQTVMHVLEGLRERESEREKGREKIVTWLRFRFKFDRSALRAFRRPRKLFQLRRFLRKCGLCFFGLHKIAYFRGQNAFNENATTSRVIDVFIVNSISLSSTHDNAAQSTGRVVKYLNYYYALVYLEFFFLYSHFYILFVAAKIPTTFYYYCHKSKTLSGGATKSDVLCPTSPVNVN